MKPDIAVPLNNSRIDLLRAAILVFSEKHFDGAGIREVADAAGVNSSLIYFHFGDKAGLYLEALQLACRMVRHIVNYLPDPPAPDDPDASQKAASVLTEYIRMFLRMSLRQGFRDPGGHLAGLEHAIFVLVMRELSSPRAGSEPYLLDAIQPHISHVNQCLQIFRPELSPEHIFRMGMSIHGQLLFFFNHQRILSLQRGEPYQDCDLEPLVEHFARFSFLGVNADDSRLGVIPHE